MFTAEDRSRVKTYGAAFVPLLGVLPGFNNPVDAIGALIDSGPTQGLATFVVDTRNQVVQTATLALGVVAFVAWLYLRRR